MRVTLYQAAEDFRVLRDQIDPETGEMPDGLGDLMDQSKDVVVHKLRACAAYLLEEEVAASVLKEQVKKLQAKLKAVEASIEWSQDYMARNMRITGVTLVEADDRTYKAKLHLGRDKSVAVVNKDVVPGPYLREVPPVERSWEVDKKKALDDLKQGIVINGLQLVERDRLEVK